MNFKKFLFGFTGFLFFFTLSLTAQSNKVIDELLDEEIASYGKTAYMVLTASADIREDSTIEAAVNYVAVQDWGIAAKAANEKTNLGEFSFLVMRSFDIRGGIMYSIAPGPRYAARELAHLGFINGSSAADRKLSGDEVMRILGRVLEWEGGRS